MRFLSVVFMSMILFLSMSPAMAGKIDINTADIEILDVGLEGIGPKKAQAIIDYREKHGFFRSVDELTHVSGIGVKTLEKNRDKIMVSLPVEKPQTAEEKQSIEEAVSTEKNVNTEPGKN